jgi:hypothetical protein
MVRVEIYYPSWMPGLDTSGWQRTKLTQRGRAATMAVEVISPPGQFPNAHQLNAIAGRLKRTLQARAARDAESSGCDREAFCHAVDATSNH